MVWSLAAVGGAGYRRVVFTGIVEGKRPVVEALAIGPALHLRLDLGRFADGVAVGDSVCVAGCCLTVSVIEDRVATFHLMGETLSLTTFGDLHSGSQVNVERSLRLGDRLGGHLVSGHVDGLAELVSRVGDVRSERFVFETRPEWARYIATKGSVCLDGVSLTVNEVTDDQFSTCIIPHTLEVTTLGSLAAGQKVNLEVDLIARYLDRLNQYGGTDSPGSLVD